MDADCDPKSNSIGKSQREGLGLLTDQGLKTKLLLAASH